MQAVLGHHVEIGHPVLEPDRSHKADGYDEPSVRDLPEHDQRLDAAAAAPFPDAGGEAPADRMTAEFFARMSEMVQAFTFSGEVQSVSDPGTQLGTGVLPAGGEEGFHIQRVGRGSHGSGQLEDPVVGRWTQEAEGVALPRLEQWRDVPRVENRVEWHRVAHPSSFAV